MPWTSTTTSPSQRTRPKTGSSSRVLSFPDMEPDDAIENLARRQGMHVIWGVENLPADLEKIVRSRRVSDRVNMESIAGAVLAVTDGQIRLD